MANLVQVHSSVAQSLQIFTLYQSDLDCPHNLGSALLSNLGS